MPLDTFCSSVESVTLLEQGLQLLQVRLDGVEWFTDVLRWCTG
jgi:hypothetical protein